MGAGVGVLRPRPLRSQGRGARPSAERAREELWSFEETRWESVAWGVWGGVQWDCWAAGVPSEGRGDEPQGAQPSWLRAFLQPRPAQLPGCSLEVGRAVYLNRLSSRVREGAM